MEQQPLGIEKRFASINAQMKQPEEPERKLEPQAEQLEQPSLIGPKGKVAYFAAIVAAVVLAVAGPHTSPWLDLAVSGMLTLTLPYWVVTFMRAVSRAGKHHETPAWKQNMKDAIAAIQAVGITALAWALGNASETYMALLVATLAATVFMSLLTSMISRKHQQYLGEDAQPQAE